MVLKPSWSLYRGRARGRERVRPTERAVAKHTTTPGTGGPRSGTFASRPGAETERAMSEANVEIHPPPLRDPPRQGRQAPRARHRRLELGAPAAADRARTEMPVGRSAVLHHRRTVAQTTVVERRPTRTAAPACRRGERPAALCAAPAPARHAVKLAHEGVPSTSSNVNWTTPTSAPTSIYLQGIENAEIIDTVHARRAPMTPATTALDRSSACASGRRGRRRPPRWDRRGERQGALGRPGAPRARAVRHPHPQPHDHRASAPGSRGPRVWRSPACAREASTHARRCCWACATTATSSSRAAAASSSPTATGTGCRTRALRWTPSSPARRSAPGRGQRPRPA
jgi:hypothetical protein